MNAHGTDRPVPTAQQIKQLGILLAYAIEIVTRVVTRYFFTLSFDEIKVLLQNKDALSKKIKVALAPVFVLTTDEYAAQRAYWESIYSKHYGMDADFSEVAVPRKPSNGKWRLIFIIKDLTMNRAAAMYRKILVDHDPECELQQTAADLDTHIPRNIRTSAESYATWVRDEPEADSGPIGQIASDQLVGISLLERLVYNTVHFIETKRHPDNSSMRCPGSQTAKGCVPSVGWFLGGRKVSISWPWSVS